MKRFLICFIAIIIFIVPFSIRDLLANASEDTLEVDLSRRGIEISPTLYGVFFEDINYSGDGGLYAELIQNRSFEFPNPMHSWSINVLGQDKAGYVIERKDPINIKNPNYIRIVINFLDKGVMLSNQGYQGISLKKGENYIFSIYARSPDGNIKSIYFEVSDRKGNIGFREVITNIGKTWKKFEKLVFCTQDVEEGKLIITIKEKGTIDLDFISLFPQNTWKGRKNGLRYDLVKWIADLKPSFIRFPGGCIVEGRSMDNAYRWKKTIGDPEERPTMENLWGYYQSLGLGFYEYFLLCEDLGAEPIPVLNCGMACQARNGNMASLNELNEYIQDALDLIEFANGPISTKWGSIRAQLGHPEPFNLKYIGIGNEQWGPEYYVRYEKFYDAIKKKYPDIKIIFAAGPSPSGKLFDDAWNWVKKTRKADLVDEHYYMSPEWFLTNINRYSTYDRNGPKVFVGEYAAHGVGRRNNLEAALCEAAYLINLEKYSDIVSMISYAPLFGKEGVSQWQPNLIWFNNRSSYATPNYYVLKILNENKGKYILPMKLKTFQDTSKDLIYGMIGLGSWQTAVEYKDLKVIDKLTNEVIYEDNFVNTFKNWTITRGVWKMKDGIFSQSTLSENCFALAGDKNWNNYTIQVKAKKNSGREGFLIMFGVKDADNFYWWNIGGWGNSYTAIEKSVGGIKSIIGTTANVTVESNKWYDIKIEISRNRIRCYLDGILIHDVEDRVLKQDLYVNAVEDEDGDIIIKVVNISGDNKKVNIKLEGLDNIKLEKEAEVIILSSESLKDENSFFNPNKIIPQYTKYTFVDKTFEYEFRKYSLTVIKIKKKF